MEIYSVFITGANRGIGLEFVRQLSRLPKPPRIIFATYRSSSSLGALTEIKNASKECEIVLIKLDVQKQEDVESARKVVEEKVGENGLTLLINNAGIAEGAPFPNITEENLLKHFTVNTFGPIRVLQEFYPLLQKAASRGASLGRMSVFRAAVINISSMAGSITRTGVELLSDLGAPSLAGSITRMGIEFFLDLEGPSYKASKAALNMAMRVISVNVKEQGILVIMMCPGFVKTDLTKDVGGEIFPEESISAMLKTFEKLNDSHHGCYMDRFGNPYQF